MSTRTLNVLAAAMFSLAAGSLAQAQTGDNGANYLNGAGNGIIERNGTTNGNGATNGNGVVDRDDGTNGNGTGNGGLPGGDDNGDNGLPGGDDNGDNGLPGGNGTGNGNGTPDSNGGIGANGDDDNGFGVITNLVGGDRNGDQNGDGQKDDGLGTSYGQGGYAQNTYGGDGYQHGDKDDRHGDRDDHDGHGKGAGHFAVLQGGNEVSLDGKANAGDRNGRGTATVTIQPWAGKLCFAMLVDGIDNPVAAHIHRGAPGENGPVVVPLQAPARGEAGTVSACVGNLDAHLLKTIREKPWAYYINVHTSPYPNGAVRGQLF